MESDTARMVEVNFEILIYFCSFWKETQGILVHNHYRELGLDYGTRDLRLGLEDRVKDLENEEWLNYWHV